MSDESHDHTKLDWARFVADADKFARERAGRERRIFSAFTVALGAAFGAVGASLLLTVGGLEVDPTSALIELANGSSSPLTEGGALAVLTAATVMITSLFAVLSTGRVLFRDDRALAAHSRFRRAAESAISATLTQYEKDGLDVPNIGSSASLRRIKEKGGDDSEDGYTGSQRPSDYLDVLVQFRRRMDAEAKRLHTNSRLNLFWGIIFSVFGMTFILISILFAPQMESGTLVELVSTYGPRSALALVLELISFFFLRLYSSTEYEIKHHKNEVTNMEAIFASALFATGSSASNQALVIKAMAGVERNFVLKRGERTVVSEVDNSQNDVLLALDKIASLVRSTK